MVGQGVCFHGPAFLVTKNGVHWTPSWVVMVCEHGRRRAEERRSCVVAVACCIKPRAATAPLRYFTVKNINKTCPQFLFPMFL